MTIPNPNPCEREYDFALIVDGIPELTEDVMTALFEAGCDDATPSVQYGLLYLEFSRSAPSLQEAILSAIRDVHKSGIPAKVLRIDECNLVTAAEIARRMGRSRQLVHQYITGQRGPGGFPAPECHLSDQSPLWAWCAVSYWLVQNNLIRHEALQHAEVVYAINTVLEQHHWHNPKLIEEVSRELQEIVS
jgi:hypothetical protein